MDNLKKKLFSEKTITVMRRFSKWLKINDYITEEKFKWKVLYS
jgi:hypothetical protein